MMLNQALWLTFPALIKVIPPSPERIPSVAMVTVPAAGYTLDVAKSKVNVFHDFERSNDAGASVGSCRSRSGLSFGVDADENQHS